MRLDQVPGRPQLVCAADVALLVRATEQDDQQVVKRRLFPNPSEHAESIQPRHLQIQQQQLRLGKQNPVGIRPRALQVRDNFLPIADEVQRDRDAGAREGPLEKEGIRRVILCHQYVS